MSEAVRWGILSTADINTKVLAGLQGSPAVDVIAVGSRDGERAKEFASQHDIPRAYGSYVEMLADPDVEAVYIPLPNGMHVEWTLASLAAGKHVLCEKPLSPHAEEVERCFEAAERAGLLLSEAFMWRHTPQAAMLQSLVLDGAIGELRLIRAAFSFLLPEVPNVRWDADLEGGALMDVGCYCVSGSRFLAGAEAERVTGESVTAKSGVDARFAGVLRFPGDVLATFDCGFDLPPRDELEAIGSDGSLFVDDPWHSIQTGIELRRADGSVEQMEVESVSPYRLELENVSAAIRGEAELRLGRDDALGQARTIEALYLSAAEGRPVAVA